MNKISKFTFLALVVLVVQQVTAWMLVLNFSKEAIGLALMLIVINFLAGIVAFGVAIYGFAHKHWIIAGVLLVHALMFGNPKSLEWLDKLYLRTSQPEAYRHQKINNELNPMGRVRDFSNQDRLPLYLSKSHKIVAMDDRVFTFEDGNKAALFANWTMDFGRFELFAKSNLIGTTQRFFLPDASDLQLLEYYPDITPDLTLGDRYGVIPVLLCVDNQLVQLAYYQELNPENTWEDDIKSSLELKKKLQHYSDVLCN